MDKKKYDGKPKVSDVEIVEVPCNPDDLGEGCKSVPVQAPPEAAK